MTDKYAPHDTTVETRADGTMIYSAAAPLGP